MSNRYTDLLTSQYQSDSSPNFVAMVQLVTDPLINNQNVLATLPLLFDLDDATGVQLDILGQWIGMSRTVQIPIVGLYFSLDVVGVGLDQGIWYQTGNPLFTSQLLGDDLYRRALQAKALANRIGRSIYDVYSVLDVLTRGTALSFVIHDYGNMSMAYESVGAAPDDQTLAILNRDYLKLRPETVSLLPTILP